MEHAENTILIVDDEGSIGQNITTTLEQAGYQWLTTNNKDDALSIILNRKPQLILLYWIISGSRSVDFIQDLKQDTRTSETPIIMLTSKSESAQQLLGLEAGADDCMTNPFSHRELIVRLKAILRRPSPKITI